MTIETWKIFEYWFPKIAATFSLFGSSLIIAEIYQDWKEKRLSRNGISAVSRALLQMSVGDIFFSSGWFLASWVVSQSENVLVSFEATQTSGGCKFQALILQFGFFSSLCFNASLAVIYLMLVRYHWPSERIIHHFNRAAVFIWLISLALAVFPLIFNLYHDTGAQCWLSPPPSDLPECQDPESFALNSEVCSERRDVTNLLLGLQVLPVWICIALNSRIMYVVYKQTRQMEVTSSASSQARGGGFRLPWRYIISQPKVESEADQPQTAKSFFGFRSSTDAAKDEQQQQQQAEDNISKQDEEAGHSSLGEGSLLFDDHGRVIHSDILPDESCLEPTCRDSSHSTLIRHHVDDMSASGMQSMFSNEQVGMSSFGVGMKSDGTSKSFLSGFISTYTPSTAAESASGVQSMFSNEQTGMTSYGGVGMKSDLTSKSFLSGFISAYGTTPSTAELDLTSHNGDDDDTGGSMLFDATGRVVHSDILPEDSFIEDPTITTQVDDGDSTPMPPQSSMPQPPQPPQDWKHLEPEGQEVKFDTSSIASSKNSKTIQPALDRSTTNNNRRSRTVAVQGLWYIGGFFFTYIVGTLSILHFLILGLWSVPLYRASYFFVAAQGAWNFVVFSKGRREMKTTLGRKVKRALWGWKCRWIPKQLVPPSPVASATTPRASQQQKRSNADITQATVRDSSSHNSRPRRSGGSSQPKGSSNQIRSDNTTGNRNNTSSNNNKESTAVSILSNASTVVHSNANPPINKRTNLNSITEDQSVRTEQLRVPQNQPQQPPQPPSIYATLEQGIKSRFAADIKLSGFSNASSAASEAPEDFGDKTKIGDSEASVCSDYSGCGIGDEETEAAPRPAARNPTGRCKDPMDYGEEVQPPTTAMDYEEQPRPTIDHHQQSPSREYEQRAIDYEKAPRDYEQPSPVAYKQPPMAYKQPSPVAYKQPPMAYKQPPDYEEQPPSSDYEQHAMDYEQPPMAYKQPAMAYKQPPPPAAYKQSPPDYKQPPMDYKQPPLDYEQPSQAYEVYKF